MKNSDFLAISRAAIFFKKLSSLILRIGISILLLFFLFRQIDKRNLWELIGKSDKILILLAGLVFFLNYVLCFLRWQMILKAIKIYLSLKKVFISYVGGVFFSLFLPSTIGGDLVRSIDLSLHTNRPGEVVATVFLDRLSGYIGVVILVLFSVLFDLKILMDKSVFTSLVIIVSILIAILLFLFNRSLYQRLNNLFYSASKNRIVFIIKEIHQKIHLFRYYKDVVFKNIGVSVIIQMVNPVAFWLIARALGAKIDILHFFVFLPIIGAITLLPVSIGGLGLREATTVYFFSKTGLSKDLSFGMSIISFFFLLIYAVAGGIIYVFALRYRRI